MKKIFLALLILSIGSYCYAGCTPDGSCITQVNSKKELEKFINDHPYQIKQISIRAGIPFIVEGHYYIWYKKGHDK